VTTTAVTSLAGLATSSVLAVVTTGVVSHFIWVWL